MGVIPSSTVRTATIGMEPRPFWQRIAQALDRFMAQRSLRAVPTQVLRRSRDDIKRCHRLISQASPIAVPGGNRSDTTSGRRSNASNRT
jgi:hypothetical protein